MTNPYDTYTSPLAARNASAEMLRLWSPRHKFNTWRRIWLAVAKAQHEVTKDWDTPLVSTEQVEELEAVVNRTNPDGTVGITDDELQLAEKYERELRHDVMAHVHTLGDACPKARPIIHLGMTSQDVVCNADLMVLNASIRMIATKISRAVLSLGNAAHTYMGTPTLGFTHYQPAQPTTVGRRCALWAHDLAIMQRRIGQFSSCGFVRFRGFRGATGSQASYLALFNNDAALVDRFETCVIKHLATDNHSTTTYELMGQTYPRVIDSLILADLASTAAVLHKIATDIRLLCNRKELDEPFESKQIGSSAMPYKRNPMRCERICGLSRFVMNLVGNAYDTAATQWLERTLDDSSNRRLSLPEAFLALDGALDLMHNVASGLIVHEATIRKNLMAELPFMATENILMACVKLGADRQDYHERIRVHAQKAGLRVKDEGLDNDLLDRLKADPAFQSKANGGLLDSDLDWDDMMDPMHYIGRSVEQTGRFIKEIVEPLREHYADAIEKLSDSGPRV